MALGRIEMTAVSTLTKSAGIKVPVTGTKRRGTFNRLLGSKGFVRKYPRKFLAVSTCFHRAAAS